MILLNLLIEHVTRGEDGDDALKLLDTPLYTWSLPILTGHGLPEKKEKDSR